MKKERLIQRYKRAERFNHWVVAGCFVLLAISGLAFFTPRFSGSRAFLARRSWRAWCIRLSA